MSENSIIGAKHKKPTYFELFKKVLNELNWREVSSFDAIEKTEHKRILNLLNATNSDILSSYLWNFQIEKTDIEIEENSSTIVENFEARIISIWEGRKKYRYLTPTQMTQNSNLADVYSITKNSIITNPIKYKRKIALIYASNCYAQDSEGNLKSVMEGEFDTSIIPMPYLEPVLVYGTLIKVKANPSFVKFNYWRTLYYEALTNLRSTTSKTYEDSPVISFG